MTLVYAIIKLSENLNMNFYKEIGIQNNVVSMHNNTHMNKNKLHYLSNLL